MPKVINFDRGSKRRLRMIRWAQRDALSLVILFVLLALLMLALAMWDANKFPGLDVPREHQLLADS